MKTLSDIITAQKANKESLEAKRQNLYRMEEEYDRTVEVVKNLLPTLESLLAKTHLTISDFSIRRPSEEQAETKKSINLSLDSDGQFKFIQFRGYDSRGAGKNHDRLNNKAEKLATAVSEALTAAGHPVYGGYVNPFSLEEKDGKTGHVLMTIFFNI